ncbi:MAG: response regulator [Candidatus Vogelbacteria bacterium]|nr:response regulator [Candidatus Vogelbacteria bacterium]
MNQNKKILIVEDDANMREVLVNRFTAEHFIVVSASDGPSGLVVALREEPDIILLDIMMPGLDGMTVMKKIRQSNAWGKQVPIILLTSLSANDSIMRGIVEDEPAYYIIKDNFSLDDVVAKVKERLEI